MCRGGVPGPSNRDNSGPRHKPGLRGIGSVILQITAVCSRCRIAPALLLTTTLAYRPEIGSYYS